ncbi:carbohydrate ABC transporter permease [Neobacillus vireti]|uniref:Binding-protein-dependent transport systems inner membrane component n=1 Tax=Neobacillus vireti LMG 21834 TaxID=1131730 RepID=A0AB94IFX9_9BACI|nr:carbohydrate ABC transporter permease [Neobacillus vireti]ETI66017.1 binding-protein-dependent transport systems inner membrane component [Neobacillus vireti LMG 21834]KLT19303.1 ABC transporter permease [Neobacillus vireti]
MKKAPVLWVKHIVLIFFSLSMVFPFLWMVISALKTKDEIWQFPPTLWPNKPMWHHFADAWAMAPFNQYIFNSIFTASAIVLIQVVNSALIAYAVTQLRFKGRNLLFSIILITYMLPVAATYVPSYVILADFNLLDTYSGLILSNAASVFGIFLFRQAFLQVPKELIEAARVDGARHWTIIWKIIFPTTKATFITFSLISFVQNYNNYLWPTLITRSESKYLITTGLRQFFIQEGAYGMQWPLIMAASAFTVLPLLILFVFVQKWIISGISDQGLKG